MLPNSSALRSYRSDKEPAYRCAAALGRRACPLRHCFAMPPLPKGEALAFRIASCIFLPKFMVYLFCGLARALTPDQQDGVWGKTPAAIAEELVFSNSMPTSWKNGALPRMSSRKKIADYFGITVEELMGTKKSPPGWASSTNRCRKLWSCFLLYL